MFCPKCGTQLNDEAKFCSNCGKNLSSITKADENLSKSLETTQHLESIPAISESIYRPQSSRKKIIKIILYSICALVALGCLVRFIYIKSEYPTLTFDEYMYYRSVLSDTIPINPSESVTIEDMPIAPIELTYVDCKIEQAENSLILTLIKKLL